MEHPWAKSTDECLRYFDVDMSVGLTGGQVERNLKKYGPNELRRRGQIIDANDYRAV